MTAASGSASPRVGLASGRRNVPAIALRGLSTASVSACRTAAATGSITGTGMRSPTFGGKPGERRTGQDDDVGAVLLDRAVGERNQQVFLLGLHLRDRLKRTVERADAGATRAQCRAWRRIPRTRAPARRRRSRWKSAARPCRR